MRRVTANPTESDNKPYVVQKRRACCVTMWGLLGGRKDAPSQRRIMRTYGATFSYLAGEPVDPDEGERSVEAGA